MLYTQYTSTLKGKVCCEISVTCGIQGDPDIRRWTNEVPSEYKENAKEKLAALSTNTDRDRARNLKELLQFYKDQVRKLERAYRRTDGDEPDNGMV